MGKYLTNAQHHLEEIQRLHDQAGDAGHSQAKYHWNEIDKIRSRCGATGNDAVMLSAVAKKADELMDAMKQRETNSPIKTDSEEKEKTDDN